MSTSGHVDGLQQIERAVDPGGGTFLTDDSMNAEQKLRP